MNLPDKIVRAIELLPFADRGQVYAATISYMLNDAEPDLDLLSDTARGTFMLVLNVLKPILRRRRRDAERRARRRAERAAALSAPEVCESRAVPVAPAEIPDCMPASAPAPLPEFAAAPVPDIYGTAPVYEDYPVPAATAVPMAPRLNRAARRKMARDLRKHRSQPGLRG